MPKIMQSLGIIPARFASTRFPGKPLVEINGKTMIQCVYEQACKSGLTKIVVATDDKRIYDHVNEFNGRVVMTFPFHKTGTDRCAEVVASKDYSQFDFIVNIQGDEPFIQPSQIDLVLSYLINNPSIAISTLAKKIRVNETLFDPNTVKVVFDKNGKALYFSRSVIPFFRNEKPEVWLDNFDFYKHIGIYAFRKDTLLELTQLSPSTLEKAESLEQLRWLEHGFQIGVQTTEIETIGVDVPEDLLKIIRF